MVHTRGPKKSFFSQFAQDLAPEHLTGSILWSSWQGANSAPRMNYALEIDGTHSVYQALTWGWCKG